ncbi:MAG: sigma-70 family RNA polymerase sigma factor [Planctomycetota bacterium]|jgi:RNA polymerase sigma-70 factor (ECF subfamily)
MSEERNDADLLERSKAGDRDALGTLVERYRDRVYRTCLRVLLRPDLAEDAGAEAFRKMIQGLHRCREEHMFKAWLLKIAYHTAIDLLRRESREKVKAEAWVLDARKGSPSAPDERTLEILSMEVDALPQEERTAVSLHYFEEMSQRDVGQVMDCSHVTVQNRIKSALGKLQTRLAARGISCSLVALEGWMPKIPLPTASGNFAAILHQIVSSCPLAAGATSASLAKGLVAAKGIAMTKKTTVLTVAPLLLLASAIGIGALMVLAADWNPFGEDERALSLIPADSEGGSGFSEDRPGEGASEKASQGEEPSSAAGAGTAGETESDLPAGFPPARWGALVGKVSDARTGEPVAGCRVSFHPLGRRGKTLARVEKGWPTSTTTGPAGEYRLPVPGGVEIGIRFESETHQSDYLVGYKVEAKKERRVDITLQERDASIAGIVTWADGGVPVQGVRVQAYWGEKETGWWTDGFELAMARIRGGKTVTGEDGGFALPIAPGKYEVHIDHPRCKDYRSGMFLVRSRERKVLTIPLELLPSAERELKIEGTVTDHDSGNPLQDVTVSYRYWEGVEDRELSTRTDAKGKFVIATPANVSISLLFNKPGYEEESWIVDDMNEETYRWPSVTLIRSEAGVGKGKCLIRGVVRHSITREPLEGIELGAYRSFGRTDYLGWFTDRGGRFRMDFGLYQDKDQDTNQVFISAVGFRKYISEKITLGKGQTHFLEIWLEPERTVIHGTVTVAGDEGPIRGAEVLLMGRHGSPRRRILADGKGRFEIEVIPGECSLQVRAPGYGRVTRSFALRGGETKTVDFSLKKTAAKITGRVIDAKTKKGIPGARVDFGQEGTGFSSDRFALTDGTGRFEYGTQPGEYLAMARKEGYRPSGIPKFQVSDIEAKTVEIFLHARSVRLTGRVLDGKTGKKITYLDFCFVPESMDGSEVPLFDHAEYLDVSLEESESFELRVASGRFKVYLYHEGYLPYRKEVFIPDKKAFHYDILLTPLPEKTAAIRGTVLFGDSGKPAAKARIHLTYMDSSLPNSSADDDGRFHVKVPPGSIEVHVYAVDPASKKRYSASLVVETHHGETHELEIKVLPKKR